MQGRLRRTNTAGPSAKLTNMVTQSSRLEGPWENMEPPVLAMELSLATPLAYLVGNNASMVPSVACFTVLAALALAALYVESFVSTDFFLYLYVKSLYVTLDNM